ncbi:MAG: hypothetical protein ACRDWD_01535 [Acidimicrobiia bacterium]
MDPAHDGNVLAQIRYRLGAFVDRALDTVFTDPFDVSSSEEAVRLMAEPPPESALLSSIPTVAALAARGGAMYRKFRAARSASSAAGGPAGISVMLLTAAGVAAVTRLLTAVRWGLRDVQVMGSYLATKSRNDGVALESGLARTLTISAYLDSRRHAGLDYANVRGVGALVGSWSTQTIANRSESTTRKRAQERIDALGRYDLPALADQWKARHAGA